MKIDDQPLDNPQKTYAVDRQQLAWRTEKTGFLFAFALCEWPKVEIAPTPQSHLKNGLVEGYNTSNRIVNAIQTVDQ